MYGFLCVLWLCVKTTTESTCRVNTDFTAFNRLICSFVNVKCAVTLLDNALDRVKSCTL